MTEDTRFTVIPNLSSYMRRKKATIRDLERASGVCKNTIERARKGHRISNRIAEKLVVALETNVFNFEVTRPKQIRGAKCHVKPVKGMINLPELECAENTDANKYPNYLKNFNVDDDPDLNYKIHASTNQRYKTRLPVHRTEEESDRLWEYNKLMGRV